MADESASAADSPRELLASVRDVTRKVRVAQRGTWFPLLVFALITLASIPIVRFSPHHFACRSHQLHGGPQATVCLVVSTWPFVYWPIALILAYVAIAGFYVYQSRRRGVGAHIRPYVVLGIAISVLATAGSIWLAGHPLALEPGSNTRIFGALTASQFVRGLVTPAAAIGIA